MESRWADGAELEWLFAVGNYDRGYAQRQKMHVSRGFRINQSDTIKLTGRDK